MRELILKQIEEAIDWGDDELVEQFGDLSKISQLPDEELLSAYRFMVSFRG